MLQRLGNVIYWTMIGAAVMFFFNGVLRAASQPIDFVAVSAIAVLIWLTGKTARHVLAG